MPKTIIYINLKGDITIEYRVEGLYTKSTVHWAGIGIECCGFD